MFWLTKAHSKKLNTGTDILKLSGLDYWSLAIPIPWSGPGAWGPARIVWLHTSTKVSSWWTAWQAHAWLVVFKRKFWMLIYIFFSPLKMRKNKYIPAMFRTWSLWMFSVTPTSYNNRLFHSSPNQQNLVPWSHKNYKYFRFLGEGEEQVHALLREGRRMRSLRRMTDTAYISGRDVSLAS